MKQLVFLLLLLTFYQPVYSQTNSICSNDTVPKQMFEVLVELHKLKTRESSANRYKMYPTQNIYNFLKLDTQTGRIEQVQWSLKDNKEFITTLNNKDLSLFNGMNSFELYPTQNIYQFILLDKATGRTWHVQWGMEDDERWIRRIY